MELRQGSTLQGGKYVIIRVLGYGNYGITYLAGHTWLKKEVAIREFFCRPIFFRDYTTGQVSLSPYADVNNVNRLRHKFLKEAEYISNIDCPYIVRIRDVFEENSTSYYVMDYIEGQSLEDIVKISGPLPVRKALGYMTKIGEALENLHSRRINHLDVRPANIKIRTIDDSPIMIEFGLSKQKSSCNLNEGAPAERPSGYNSGCVPIELFSLEGVKDFSPRTDVYALGATLYYMLSGQTPPISLDLVTKGLTFPATIPESLRRSISKSMSPRRKDRYHNINSFIEAIGAQKNSSGFDPSEVIIPNVEPPTDTNDIEYDGGTDVNEFIVEDPPFYKQPSFITCFIIIVLLCYFLFT